MIKILLLLLLSLACNKNESSPSSSRSYAPSAKLDPHVSPVTTGSWYKPVAATTFQIQLKGTLNTSYNVGVYDIDLYDTSTSQIAALKSSGKKVICYFSGGSSEDWRTDYSSFDKRVLGKKLDGWEGERWLDIRSQNVLDIMLKRLDLAVTKGCDGVDPDNMDGYTNKSGFPLTFNDQLAYNKRIANEARSRGLAVGLKNDGSQGDELEPFFDFSVNEQCHYYHECGDLAAFTDSNKPIFNIEYDLTSSICPTALAANIRTLLMPDLLDGSSRVSCD